MNKFIVRTWGWFLIVGLALWGPGVPRALGQLEDQDPVLYAALSAFVETDPELQRHPEWAVGCVQLAEATLVNPIERGELTREVAIMRQEGVDVDTLVPEGIRQAARERFELARQQQLQDLEMVWATDPGRARTMELELTESERQMRSFVTGERYVPSSEMIARAEGMYRAWEAEAATRGVSPMEIYAARAEFTRWSTGPLLETSGRGGPGGMGMTGPPPSVPELAEAQRRVDAWIAGNPNLTPDQIAAARQAFTEWAAGNRGPGMFGQPGGGTGTGTIADRGIYPGGPGMPSVTPSAEMITAAQGRLDAYLANPDLSEAQRQQALRDFRDWSAGTRGGGMFGEPGSGTGTGTMADQQGGRVTPGSLEQLGLTPEQIAGIGDGRRSGDRGWFISRWEMVELGLNPGQIAGVEAAAGYPSGGGGGHWEDGSWRPGTADMPRGWHFNEQGQLGWIPSSGDTWAAGPGGGRGGGTWSPPPGDPSTWSPEQRAAYAAGASQPQGGWDPAMSGGGPGYGGPGGGPYSSGETQSWAHNPDGTWSSYTPESWAAAQAGGGGGYMGSGSGWDSATSGGGGYMGGTSSGWDSTASGGGGYMGGTSSGWDSATGTSYSGGGGYTSSGGWYASPTENLNYDAAQATQHGCLNLTAEQKAEHQAHGHCPGE